MAAGQAANPAGAISLSGASGKDYPYALAACGIAS